MISFQFDNCAIEELTKLTDYARIKEKMRESILLSASEFRLSRVNLDEFLKGVSKSNFQRLQYLCREAVDLMGAATPLITPSGQLRESLRALTDDEREREIEELRYRISLFLSATSFQEFERSLGSESRRIRVGLELIRDLATGETLKLAVQRSALEGALSPEAANAFFNSFHKSVLEHFGIKSLLSDNKPSQVASKLPSIFYYTLFYQLLTRKRLLHSARVKIGDYFDLERIVYLDTCDYLVTEDKALIHLFDMSDQVAGFKLPSPYGRAIRSKRFVQYLEGQPLIARTTVF